MKNFSILNIKKTCKVLLFFIILALFNFSIFAFGKSEKSEQIEPTEPTKQNGTIQNEIMPSQINFGVLNGPSGMCFAQMFENVQFIKNVPMNYAICASPDVILPKLLKNELDFGILPPNVAAKVFNSSNEAVICAAVSGVGMLNIVSTNPNIKNFQHLKGKTLHVAGRAATPEYLLRYLLQKNGISENEIELDFSISASEMPALLLSGKIENALLPEPFTTLALQNAKKNEKNLYIALNLQSEWQKLQANIEKIENNASLAENAPFAQNVKIEKNAENVKIEKNAGNFENIFTNSNYPMTLIVVTKNFAQKYPELVKEFLKYAKISIDFTIENPKIAGEMVEKNTLGLKSSVASMAIPNCAFCFLPAQSAKPQIEQLLSIFLQFSPNSIGGTLPNNNFYFE